jgi:hypothetical protein
MLPENFQYPLTPCKICQRVADNLWHICQGIALITVHTKRKLSAIPMEKVEFKVKNQKAKVSYKNYERFIFKDCSIHTYYKQSI